MNNDWKMFGNTKKSKAIRTLLRCCWLLWKTFSSLRICCCWGYEKAVSGLNGCCCCCCRLLINVLVDNVDIGLFVLLFVGRISLNRPWLVFELLKYVCCERFKLLIDGKYRRLSSFSMESNRKVWIQRKRKWNISTWWNCL